MCNIKKVCIFVCYLSTYKTSVKALWLVYKLIPVFVENNTFQPISVYKLIWVFFHFKKFI